MKKILLSAWLVLVTWSSLALAQNSTLPNTMDRMTPPPAMETIPSETKELIRKLLEANGTRESLNHIFEEIIGKSSVESQAELRKVLSSDVVIERVIPIYAKYFSATELRELVTFYKSPVGLKNLKLTPTLMSEVMQNTAKYFDENAKILNAASGALPTGQKRK